MDAGSSQTVGKNNMANGKKDEFISEYGIWFYSMQYSIKV